MVVFAVTNPIRPTETEPVTWTLSAEHPIVGNGVVITRMFSVENGLEIYSTGNDAKTGRPYWARTFIPMHCIRTVQEVMGYDVYVKELFLAEADDDDDEPDDEFEDEEEEPEVTPAANGQPSSSSTSS